MDGNVRPHVTWYSGYTCAQRPSSLTWQGTRRQIVEIIAEWKTPEGRRFYVRTEDHSIFEIFYFEAAHDWQVKQITV